MWGIETPYRVIRRDVKNSNQRGWRAVNILNKRAINSIIVSILQPPEFSGGFLLGGNMRIGLEIEQIRQKLGLSVVFMCNAMDLTTGEYQKLLCGRYRLNIFQLIGFIGATCHPLPLNEHPSLLYPATTQRKNG